MTNVKFSVNYLGKRKRDTWEHFAWLVTINGIDFEYCMGIANFTPFFKRDKQGFQVWGAPRNKKPENGIANAELQGWLHAPQLKDVLYCLFSDTEAGSYSFNDFCANFGYDNDSLKALDVYRACMESAPKLRKALGADFASIQKEIEAMNG